MVDLFDPVVRATDSFSGERVSMRVGGQKLFTVSLFWVCHSLFLILTSLGRLIWSARMDESQLGCIVIKNYPCESPFHPCK